MKKTQRLAAVPYDVSAAAFEAHQRQVHQRKQLCHVEILFIVLHEEAHGTVATGQNYPKLFADKLSMLLCKSLSRLSCQWRQLAALDKGNCIMPAHLWSSPPQQRRAALGAA